MFFEAIIFFIFFFKYVTSVRIELLIIYIYYIIEIGLMISIKRYRASKLGENGLCFIEKIRSIFKN